MSFINVKTASKALTIAASILCLGGIVSFFRVDGNTKAIALNVAVGAGAIAVGSHLSSALCNDAANYQVSDILDKHERELKVHKQDTENLNQKLQKQSGVLKEVQELNAKQSQSIASKDVEIGLKNSLIIKLQEQLQGLQEQFAVKTLEVAEKLAEDDRRLEMAIVHLKNNFIAVLKTRIDTQYEWLANSICSKIGKKDYESIHDALQALYSNLKVKHDSHYNLLNEIASLEGSNEEIVKDISDIFFQIFDEICGLKVRYRNTLNNDERLTLELAMEELNERRDAKKFIPYPKVKGALDHYKVFQDEQLQGLHGKVRENFDGLNEMREQVNDLIDEIETRNLQIDDLKNQIKKLNEPLRWAIAINHQQKAGNIIINFFYQKGYILDRSHYIGDNCEVDLYFHCDRNKSMTILAKDLNEHGEYLGQISECLAPVKFEWDTDNHLMKAHIVMHRRPKKVVTAQEIVTDVRGFLKQPSSLIDFVREAFHIGLWAETGGGKTTAISNIIGGMVQDLGAAPTIRTTIPKIDADTAKIFPAIDWLGVPNSIFGMLEAALEIQYRIWVAEQAYVNGEDVPEFKPILFFIDEINLIFGRWRKVNDADLIDVLTRFENTLEGERLEYFNSFMKVELMNYKGEFAKRLLLFIWQTGRSLRVKSLIAGQNLQPGSFGIMVNDLANCAYIATGDCIQKCGEYKVKDACEAEINSQYKLIQQAQQSDKALQYTALYCPNKGNSYFGLLPEPNYYQWDKNLLTSKSNQVVTGANKELIEAIVNYLKNSKDKSPKTTKAMRKNSRNLKNWSQEEIDQACKYLTGQLIELVGEDSYKII